MKSEDIKTRKWTEREKGVVRNIAAMQSKEKVAGGRRGLSQKQLGALVRLRDARPRKVAVSVRLDSQVFDWLKSKGAGHLTLVNDILVNLMEAESATRPAPR